ncbi:hypothetical protein C8R46DRAFT_1255740, partial [Mycena filopes]
LWANLRRSAPRLDLGGSTANSPPVPLGCLFSRILPIGPFVILSKCGVHLQSPKAEILPRRDLNSVEGVNTGQQPRQYLSLLLPTSIHRIFQVFSPWLAESSKLSASSPASSSSRLQATRTLVVARQSIEKTQLITLTTKTKTSTTEQPAPTSSPRDTTSATTGTADMEAKDMGTRAAAAVLKTTPAVKAAVDAITKRRWRFSAIAMAPSSALSIFK